MAPKATRWHQLCALPARAVPRARGEAASPAPSCRARGLSKFLCSLLLSSRPRVCWGEGKRLRGSLKSGGESFSDVPGISTGELAGVAFAVLPRVSPSPPMGQTPLPSWVLDSPEDGCGLFWPVLVSA